MLVKYLYSLLSKKHPLICSLKVVGIFTHLYNSYIVFFLGHKKYIYFPIYFFKNFFIPHYPFIFKNVFTDKNFGNFLLSASTLKSSNFVKFFASTGKLFKRDKLRIFIFSFFNNFKAKLKYSFYASKIKTTKFYLISGSKFLCLIKNFDVSIFNLFIRSKYLRFRNLHFCYNNIFLICIFKKLSFFLTFKIFFQIFSKLHYRKKLMF